MNKVLLIGNLAKDPEIRYSDGGNACAKVRLITNERWKDRQTGEQKQRTEGHNLVFFGRQAEVVAEHLKSGEKLFVEGRNQTRKYQGQDGQDRYITEVVVKEMEMLGGSGNRGNQQGSGANQAQQRQPAAQSAAPPDQYIPGNGGNGDDDIPW